MKLAVSRISKFALLSIFVSFLVLIPSSEARNLINTSAGGYLLCVEPKTSLVRFLGKSQCPKGFIRLVLGAKGEIGSVGPAGASGPEGKAGLPGQKGADGNKILYGDLNPKVSIGNDGDFYLNTSTYVLFGPKINNDWGNGKVLIGSQGPKGDKGDPGTNGSPGATGAQGPAGTQYVYLPNGEKFGEFRGRFGDVMYLRIGANTWSVQLNSNTSNSYEVLRRRVLFVDSQCEISSAKPAFVNYYYDQVYISSLFVDSLNLNSYTGEDHVYLISKQFEDLNAVFSGTVAYAWHYYDPADPNSGSCVTASFLSIPVNNFGLKVSKVIKAIPSEFQGGTPIFTIDD